MSLIAKALNTKEIICPLLFLNNTQFNDYFVQAYSPYKIYHATEDNSADFSTPHSSNSLSFLNQIINIANEVVCDSLSIMNCIFGHNNNFKSKVNVIANEGDEFNWLTNDSCYMGCRIN